MHLQLREIAPRRRLSVTHNLVFVIFAFSIASQVLIGIFNICMTGLVPTLRTFSKKMKAGSSRGLYKNRKK